MMQFCTLVSGSSGNAVYLSYQNTKLLIDCGISGKQLAACLASIDVHPQELSGILVTHEHIDHAKGVGVVSRRYDIPVLATAGTWSGMDIGSIAPKNERIIQAETPMTVGDIGVLPFAIPHDAAEPTGFKFQVGNTSVAVATDMGHISPQVQRHLAGCETVILEANYDANMLQTGPYPYPLKVRISGRHGHLCNDDAGVLATYLVEHNTKYIMLGHLSAENNSHDLAFATVANELELGGVRIGRDVLLSVAPRYQVSRMMGA